MDPLIN